MKERPEKLRRASAYYRVAAKFDRAGQGQRARHYRAVADRLVDENRRDQERFDRLRRDWNQERSRAK